MTDKYLPPDKGEDVRHLRGAVLSIIWRIATPFLGRKSMQSAWYRLYLLTLAGMNIGTGSYVAHSGEIWLIQRFWRTRRGQENTVVFDIGANIGAYAAQFLKDRYGQLCCS